MRTQGRAWLGTAGGASGVSPEEAALHGLFRVMDARYQPPNVDRTLEMNRC